MGSINRCAIGVAKPLPRWSRWGLAAGGGKPPITMREVGGLHYRRQMNPRLGQAPVVFFG
jgi:hypothetical protein